LNLTLIDISIGATVADFRTTTTNV